MFSLIFIVVGMAILIKSATFLVDGASSLALKLRIAPIVIGLTVVAFGTSAPELLVSMTSAVQGNTNIALGNVVGSNIANILLILGIAAIIYPLKVQKTTIWKEIPMSFLGACVITVLGLQTILDQKMFNGIMLNATQQVGEISLSNGIILLFFFLIFMYYTFGIAKVTGEDTMEMKQFTTKTSILFIIIGLIGLVIGSKVTVDHAVLFARTIGISDTLVGLTIVAVGTSLPELVTSATAALKKNTDIAVGNVVGSNIFNIFFILGLTSLVKTIPLTGQHLVDILVLFGATIFLFISMFIFKRHHISRAEGILMILAYIGYTTFLVIRG